MVKKIRIILAILIGVVIFSSFILFVTAQEKDLPYPPPSEEPPIYLDD